MSKKEEVKEEIEVKVKKDPRTELWEKYVDAYMKANPVKGEAKKKNGEFDKIPDSFKGRILMTKKGEIII